MRFAGVSSGHAAPHRYPPPDSASSAACLARRCDSSLSGARDDKTHSAGELELIGSTPLRVPDGCAVAGSVIVEFTVDAQGRTTDIRPASAPACLRQALTAWVGSFRYSPPGTQTRTSVEWLLVEAKRGS